MLKKCTEKGKENGGEKIKIYYSKECKKGKMEKRGVREERRIRGDNVLVIQD